MYKPLLKLASASVLAQVISFAVMPIITRIHNPESLGQYQFFATIALILAPFVTGSFQFSIKSAKTRYRALVRLKLAFQFSLFVSILLLVVSLIAAPVFLSGPLEWFSVYVPLVIFFVFISANFQFAVAYFANNKNYNKQSFLLVKKTVISNSLKLGFSFFSRTGLSLMLAVFLTEVIQVVWLIRKNYRSIFKNLFKFEFLRFKKNIYAEYRYPTYVTFTSATAILMNWFPILVSGFFYGPEHAGFLGLAFMVVNTPVYPFVEALRNVCFGELARDFSLQKCAAVYRKCFTIALFPSVLGLVVLGAYGSEIFSLVFSKDWEVSGSYAFICFFPISLSLLLSPVYSTLNHFLGFQRVFFLINLVALVLGLSATSYIGYVGGEFRWFLICFSIVVSVNHVLMFLFSIYLSIRKLDPSGCK